jgi:hypothetical protein
VFQDVAAAGIEVTRVAGERRCIGLRNKGPTPAAVGRAMHSNFLIRRTLRIAVAMFPKLLPVFFAVKVVEWLPNLITLNNPGTSTSEIMWSAGATFLGIVLGTVSEAIIVYGVLQYLRNNTITLQKPLELVIRRFAPLFVLGILVALLWIVGFVLLIVPCLIFMMITYVAIPAFQIEGRGPVASIKRSAQLSTGYRWKLFALVLITTGVEILADQGLQWLYTWSDGGFEMLAALLLWNTLWGLFSSIVTGVAYFELLAAKEGVDIHTREIAAVFD